MINPHRPDKQVYLTCTRHKGRPRKHVAVCRRCRWKNSCRTFLNYRQPELPFGLRAGGFPLSTAETGTARRKNCIVNATRDSRL